MHAVFLLLASVHSPLQAQMAASEYQVKAAFLYKFASYVEWPAGSFSDAQSALVIGVLAAPAMYESLLDVVRDQSVQGRSIEVRRVDSVAEPADLHVLFVGSQLLDTDRTLHLGEVQRAILVVTENAQLSSDSDGMINFAIADNRIGFDVALAPTERAGLKLSSRLLQVARNVVVQP